jgi:PAS domain S-box-containing protein
MLSATGLPHAYCFTFDPALIRVHVAADALIGLAYYSIPFALLYFARRRADLPFPWIFLLFAVFIIACGTTHWIEIWTLWHPQYWLSGAVKMITAAASVPTAAALVYLVPHALRIPTASQLALGREALEREVVERRRVEAELRAAQAALETQVAERTAALEHANRELREERLFLQMVLDNTPAIIHVKDAEGRLLLVNREFARVAGRPIEAIVGRPIGEVLANRQVTRIIEHDHAVMSGSQQVEQEEVLDLPDGRHTYLSVKVPAEGVGFPGRVLCGFTVDITERKRAEEALRAEDANKNRFLAMLSHELRNPLNAVRVALALLGRDGVNERERDVARRVMGRQVGQLARLLDDLLDIARITGDRLELRRETVALRHAIAAAVETSQPVLDARRHTLTLDEISDDVRVDGDPTRLAQVFSNLLNNAAKYTPSGGHVHVGIERRPGAVDVLVRDDGLGFTPAQSETLFRMFSSQHGAGDGQGGGLGLGLYIVKALVERHGGSVTAESAGLGCGASFRVTLPIVAAAAAATTSPEEPPGRRSARRCKVLVVDDNEDAARTLAAVLELDGHSVRFAQDAQGALAEIEREVPEVAILDIGLPDMDGYALARRLRASPEGRDLTLVALTGWGSEAAKCEAREAGFDHHLTKPVQFDALDAILAGSPRPRSFDAGI